MKNDAFCRSYSLMLSDGRELGFHADIHVSGWLDEFARILALKECKSHAASHDMFFFETGSLSGQDAMFLSGGWQRHRQGAAHTIFSHDDVTETYMAIDSRYVAHPEIKYINMSASIRQVFRCSMKYGGVPVHCAFSEFNGNGILIAAQGGTGKSTCSRRLPAGRGWKSVSDDIALIVRNCAGEYMAHPMPTWSDYLQGRSTVSLDVSYSARLKAVFFLEQARTDEVEPLGKTASAHRLFDNFGQVWGNYWPVIEERRRTDMTRKLFDTSLCIADEIPCYSLKATLTGSFWEKIEQVI